jgi:DNA-binding FrmR family transcriptional regulator
MPLGGTGIRARNGTMNTATKSKVVSRLQRIAGQVEGMGRMVESDRHCDDVLLQIASVQAALNQVNKLILSSHVETCMAAMAGSHGWGRGRLRRNGFSSSRASSSLEWIEMLDHEWLEHMTRSVTVTGPVTSSER